MNTPISQITVRQFLDFLALIGIVLLVILVLVPAVRDSTRQERSALHQAACAVGASTTPCHGRNP